MARVVGIGHQCYDELIENNGFYIDKTGFISEWWENFDSVTLITRPRRFGKTLNMSMVEQFFLLIMRDGVICLKRCIYGMKSRRMVRIHTDNCREPIR